MSSEKNATATEGCARPLGYVTATWWEVEVLHKGWSERVCVSHARSLENAQRQLARTVKRPTSIYRIVEVTESRTPVDETHNNQIQRTPLAKNDDEKH